MMPSIPEFVLSADYDCERRKVTSHDPLDNSSHFGILVPAFTVTVDIMSPANSP